MKYCTHCGCEVVDDASLLFAQSVDRNYQFQALTKNQSLVIALMAEKTDLPLQALCAHSLFHY